MYVTPSPKHFEDIGGYVQTFKTKFGKVEDEDDDNFEFEHGSKSEDRMHVIADFLLYDKERYNYVIELGKKRVLQRDACGME